MRDYIRPDEQFQWFRGEVQLIPALSNKYSVMYGDGPLQAQNGMATRSPSRLTALFIADPDVSDAGMYTCAVNGTFAIVELTVNDPFGRLFINVPIYSVHLLWV